MQLSPAKISFIVIVLQLLSLSGRAQGQTTGCDAACTQNGGKCVQGEDSQSYRCDCSGTGSTLTNCAGARSASPPANASASSTPPASTVGTYTCPVACVNGNCRQQESINQYYCDCLSGYEGASCNSSASPTAPPPSSNNSSSTRSGSYTCPVPCEQGQCVETQDSQGYSCKCNAGYSGNSCSQANSSPAASPPSTTSTTGRTPPAGTYTCPVACDNGQCLDAGSNNYYCKCNSGYSGNSCSKAASPAASPPSSNSTNCTWCKHGTCKPIANSKSEYYCECASGYSNWDCNTVTATTTSSSRGPSGNEHGGRTLKGWKIFVIVLACMVGVVLAASVAYIVYRRRRSPKTFVRFQDNEMGFKEAPEIEIRKSQFNTAS